MGEQPNYHQRLQSATVENKYTKGNQIKTSKFSILPYELENLKGKKKNLNAKRKLQYHVSVTFN